MYIAVFKLLGTLSAGVLLMLLSGTLSLPSLLFTASVLLYDVIYVIMLYRQFRLQGLNPFTRRPHSPKPLATV
jgi:hypothetical protein